MRSPTTGALPSRPPQPAAAAGESYARYRGPHDPVNAIWEGSGNVQCLDVLRAMEKEPTVLDCRRIVERAWPELAG